MVRAVFPNLNQCRQAEKIQQGKGLIALKTQSIVQYLYDIRKIKLS